MSLKITQDGIQYPDGTIQSIGKGPDKDNGDLISVQTFTASGTWAMPTGCTKLHIMLVGGGGGGCGYAESGGAGGYAEKIIDTSSWAEGTTVSVTIGGAGSGTGYHSGAGDGGTTSFGSYVSATGGYGANRNYSHTGGRGGYGSGGDINLYGGGGGSHKNHPDSNSFESGKGGGSFFGDTLSGHHANWYAHYNENNASVMPYGAGGAGQTHSYSRGGHGNNGVCIVYSYR